MRRVLSAVALGLVLMAAGEAHAQTDSLVVRRAGASPEIDTDSEAGVGEAIYSEFSYSAELYAVLGMEVELTRKGHRARRGQRLEGRTYLGRQFFCSLMSTNSLTLSSKFACLRDKDEDGVFEGVLVQGYKPPAKQTGLGIPYELREVPLEDGDSFRRELVYQGAGRGVLRLLYREFSNNMARPAFSQEATYDLEEEGDTVVVFKGARIEVAEAGNEGIRYRVLQGFD